MCLWVWFQISSFAAGQEKGRMFMQRMDVSTIDELRSMDAYKLQDEWQYESLPCMPITQRKQTYCIFLLNNPAIPIA